MQEPGDACQDGQREDDGSDDNPTLILSIFVQPRIDRAFFKGVSHHAAYDFQAVRGVNTDPLSA